MNGVLLLTKPMGFTSFDAVAVARKQSATRKIGHCGTLDPNATGVLPILLGAATKAQDILPNHDKEYVAGFKFGYTSDTLDIWGDVKKTDNPKISTSCLEDALKEFRGEIMQVPPMYSALKSNGQRLYDLARQGIEIKREARPVTIHSLELISFDEESQSGKIKVFCSKGTYIRSLIDDIGKALKTFAVMSELQRTKACGFSISDCITIEQLKTMSLYEIEEKLLPIEKLFESLRSVQVSPLQCTRFSNGGVLSAERLKALPKDIKDQEILRVKFEERFLGLGIYCAEISELKTFKLFNKQA